jgi:hypothetical protein
MVNRHSLGKILLPLNIRGPHCPQVGAAGFHSAAWYDDQPCVFCGADPEEGTDESSAQALSPPPQSLASFTMSKE